MLALHALGYRLRHFSRTKGQTDACASQEQYQLATPFDAFDLRCYIFMLHLDENVLHSCKTLTDCIEKDVLVQDAYQKPEMPLTVVYVKRRIHVS